MSVEFQIIPSLEERWTWRDLRENVMGLALDEQARAILGSDPQLEDWRDNSILDENAPLVLGRYYSLITGANTTLSIAGELLETETDEQQLVREYARNLTWPQIEALELRWLRFGYSYSVETRGGRAVGEGKLFTALCASIAMLSRGTVLVKERVVTLPIGVYDWEEFANARWDDRRGA
jgi:hypothetical protein